MSANKSGLGKGIDSLISTGKIVNGCYPVFSASTSKLQEIYERYRRLIKKHRIIPTKISDLESVVSELKMIKEDDRWVSSNKEGIISPELRNIINAVDIKSIYEFRMVSAIYLGDGVWWGNGNRFLAEYHVKPADLPMSKESLFNVLIDTKMDPYIVFRLVCELSDGKGLSEEMRDELWMGFAPDWLAMYCEGIKSLPSEKEIEECTTILLTILWFSLRERVNKKEETSIEE